MTEEDVQNLNYQENVNLHEYIRNLIYYLPHVHGRGGCQRGAILILSVLIDGYMNE